MTETTPSENQAIYHRRGCKVVSLLRGSAVVSNDLVISLEKSTVPTETIAAIYGGGIFKPLWKIAPEAQTYAFSSSTGWGLGVLEFQKNELSGISGIGDGGISDVSRRPDQHIHGG